MLTVSSARQTDPINLGGPVDAGATLQKSRLEQQWSIEDIAANLNLSGDIIEALEAGDYSSLPEWTFVRGYLTAYARLLGVAEDTIVANTGDPHSTPGDLGSVVPVMDGSVLKTRRKRIPSDAKMRDRAYRRRSVLIGVCIVIAVLIAWWIGGLRPSALFSKMKNPQHDSASMTVKIPLDASEPKDQFND
nr:helix-turn-helix domain-containing protein [Gammaproteobacteria bacterium]